VAAYVETVGDRIALNNRFPALENTPSRATSPSDPIYNCIAWAISEKNCKWWPGPFPEFYWPPGIPLEETQQAFEALFHTFSFEPCASGDLEPGYEKLALYVDAGGKPQHAARQLPSGQWTSKLGSWLDIEHTLPGIEGKWYGHVAVYFRRPLEPAQPAAAPAAQVQGA
jgi:hypothetical protein